MYRIRPAGPDDLASLTALVREQMRLQRRFDPTLRPAEEIDWTRHVSARLGRRGARILVAERDGGIVGYIDVRIARRGIRPLHGALRPLDRLRVRAGHPARLFTPVRCGFIDDLYVSSAARRGRLGGRLHDEAIRWLAQRGVREVDCVVSAANSSARRFLERRGFRQVKLLMRLHLEGEAKELAEAPAEREPHGAGLRAGDALLFVPVFCFAVIAPALMRLRMSRLESLLTPRRLHLRADPARVARVIRCVHGAQRLGRPFVRTGCTTRALTLYYFLGRAGLDLRLCFGVRYESGELVGHCWLEREGRPFLERCRPDPEFTEVYSFPGRGAVA